MNNSINNEESVEYTAIDNETLRILMRDSLLLKCINEINKSRKINTGDKVYYITSSQFFKDPATLTDINLRFIPGDTLKIKRNGETVKNLFIYKTPTILRFEQ